MKINKFFWVIMFVLILSHLSSFSQDLVLLKHKIDSLKQVENTFKIEGSYYTGFLRGFQLTANEEEQLVDYIATWFESDSLNLHNTAYDLIFSIGHFSKNEETRQQVVELLLDKVNYLAVDANLAIRFNKMDYSNAAKTRLQKIVFEGKTQKEIEMNTHFYKLGHTMESLGIDKKAKQIAEKNKRNKDLQLIKDSLYNIYVESDKENYKKDCCKPYLIMGIGWLDMKECIPQLEKLLLNNPYHESEELKLSIKYALAKLGVKTYEDEIFRTAKNLNFKYLASEKALYKYLELNYDTKKTFYFTSARTKPIPYSYRVILNVQDFVLNYPHELKLDPFETINIDINKSKKGYYWLKAHKGELELDKDAWNKN